MMIVDESVYDFRNTTAFLMEVGLLTFSEPVFPVFFDINLPQR
jgi:hypothetical protein